MQYARCKCGLAERWDSGYPIYPCQGCEKCQTTLARGPDGHNPLQPHQLRRIEEVTYVDGIETKRITRNECKVCGDLT